MPAPLPAQLAASYPFASRWFDRGAGLRMHYVDEGRGDPLLMVHGNPSWSFLWRGLIKALAPRARCIAPDHIGMGLSDKPDDRAYRYTLASRVDDLERFVEHLALDRPLTLIAHDWGGMIAMALAVRRPEAVGRIVLMNTAAFPKPAGKRLPLLLKLGRNSRLGALLIRGFNAFAVGATRLAVRRPLAAEVRAGYTFPYRNWADRIATLRFVQDIPLGPEDPAWPIVTSTAAALAQFRDRPILLAWGLRDFVFDHHFLAEFRRYWPEAEVLEYPEAGHYLLEDAGADLIPRIADFLDRHPLLD